MLYSGGGIDASGSVELSVINCVFNDNKVNGNAGYGGGLRFYNTDNYDAKKNVIKVAQCTFTGNTAKGDGGGLRIEFGSDENLAGMVENCTFTGNTTTGNGGGLYMTSQGNMPTVNFCTFVDNAANEGAEIYAKYNTNGNDTVAANITNSLIWSKTADNAIKSDKVNVTLLNCLKTADLPSTLTSKDVDVVSEDKTITHTVFRVEENPALNAAIGKGTSTMAIPAPDKDQLGSNRKTGKPDIGAVEYTGGVRLSASPTTTISGAVNVPLNLTVSFDTAPALESVWSVDASKVTDPNITIAFDSTKKNDSPSQARPQKRRRTRLT